MSDVSERLAPPNTSLLPQQFFWESTTLPGKIWVGVPPAVDPTGLKMILDLNQSGGPFLPMSGGTLTGPLIYTATGGTVPRSAQDRAADVANVLDFGADPTGVNDSAPAIKRALAMGKTVWMPMGNYRLLSMPTVGLGQTLEGDGVGTVLNFDFDFDPAAPGLIAIAPGPNPGVQFNQRATLRHFQINCTVPADTITTAAAASNAGATAITVASAANIIVGFYVADATNPAAIQRNFQHTTGTTVVSIAGNVVTLSTPVLAPGVANGDSICFAPQRSQYAPLGSSSNLAGGTGTRYPWAIYNNGANGLTIDGVLIRGAWNGIYQRGDAFDFRNLSVCAINVGLDVDQCYNFPSLINYRFFNWGYEGHSAGIGPYYDGQTIAANLGECDGLSCVGFQTWVGILNITPNWSWGHLVNVMLDSDKANLSVQGQSGGFLILTNIYSTKTTASLGVPFTINTPATVRFNNLHTTNSTPNSTMLVQQGYVFINGCNHFNGITVLNTPSFNVTGGRLVVSGGMRAVSGFAGAGTIFFANSGAGVLQVQNVTFETPATGGSAFQITDNVANIVRNIVWNGWQIVSVPDTPLGQYDDPTTSHYQQLNVSGGTMIVGASALATPPTITMVAATGVSRRFQFNTATGLASGQRWSLGANSTPEGGTATGSDFFLNAWDNNGNLLSSPITIARSTGVVTMANGAVISTIDGANIGGVTPGPVVGTTITANAQLNAPGGTLIVGASALATSPTAMLVAASGVTKRLQFSTGTGAPSGQRWSLGSNSTPEGGTATGSDFFLNAWDNNGNLLSSPITIARSTGAIKLGGGGAWTANGSTAVSLTALGPAGAHATVQEWLTLTDAAGNARYIPCF